ncbi:PREDICTED: uncharacterized protein LOC109147035 [Ipomoea nil]|uniref:uncharacterized protein LOC109147035 n=1 Tax=Ipomoea nil TaxID=35883 RepID=UPI0009009268|nr:PREDICTED: uncharacterized protein LOC109147035 [Ipomoea nil]
MDINGVVVRRILVDTGSSVNVLYLETFIKMGMTWEQLSPVKTPLTGFTGDSVEAEGSITLPVEIGSCLDVQRLSMKFIVVNLACTVRCDRKVARDCYLQACKGMSKREIQVHEIAERPPKRTIIPRPEPAVELEEVEIDSTQPDRRVRIGVGLPEEVKEEIIKAGEPLFLYLAASCKAVSSVLVREEERVRHPVYYVSRSLKAAESRYTALEKIVYALVITVRKLAPYFQAHTIRVLTDQPLGSVLRNPSSSGRLVKWAVELTQYGIEYQPRPSIKGQALADFLVECTASEEEKERAVESCLGEWWEMHADGASSRQHCGGGVVLITPEGFRLYYALSYLFQASNNEAEYEAVLNGLRVARALGVERLRVKTDSKLVVGEISGTCEAKNARMTLYRERAVEMLKEFGAYEIEYISRTDNIEADILSKIALEGVPDHLVKICQKEELSRPSIEEAPLRVQQVTSEEWDREKNPEMFWIEDIRRFIEKGELPEDPGVAARVRRKAPSFQIVDGQLYKRSFGGPLLRCLLRPEAEKIIDEAHRGICAAHQGAHTLARKLVVQGYYWPTMMRDCIEWISKCGVCQAFAKKDTRPATFYTPVTTAIPFAKWGIDLLGPLPVAPGGLKFCVVAIDYFTKVICRFGLPEHIVSDNGRQFDCQAFTDFCRRHEIRHTKVSVAYPQANGQVENVNRTLVDGIRKKLEDIRGNWADELDRVLWAYRTIQRRATGESPFSLAYGFEAKRKAASARMAEYQQAVKRYRDRRIRPRAFQVGDLVLRDRQASQPTEGGKLVIKWEGPYRIAEVVQAGTYKLETMEGKPVDRIWNVIHLKKFYQ